LGNTNIVCRVQDITSVAAFRSALREADYDILVISAHGGMEPRQHRTGFWCGNELVVEDELGPLPKIVCFSSCQVSPRGYGTTNITDLMYRQGALVVLGTLVPINVVRNAVLMTRFFYHITEAQQGKMPENTLDAVWQLTASSNAVNDILGGNMSLLQDLLEAKGTPNI
jgi:CHAT domain-containing protein